MKHWRMWAVAGAVTGVCLTYAAAARAEVSGATLFHIFLKDGTTVASYGEFARVGERVVFSLPVGLLTESPSLQLMSLSAATVDWDRTARYADAARYARYASTQGETDFALLTSDVAKALNEIALSKDPARRLALAETARKALAQWPRAHFAYRASDVRDLGALFDETIAELRSDQTGRSFNLNLVATIEPPSTPLLADPAPQQLLEQAASIARLSDVPAERISLRQAIMSALERPSPLLPRDWIDRTRSVVHRELRAEVRVETAYSELTVTLAPKASKLAAQGDVGGVSSVLEEIRRRDERLGRQRPDQVAALMAVVEDSLESARRMRLLRDRWSQRVDAYRAYWGSVRTAAEQLASARIRLESIKTLAGPDPSSLGALRVRFERVSRRLALVVAPTDLGAVHATLSSASHLASEAVRIREQAIAAGDVAMAWNASAAASGSLMLLQQARTQMESFLKPPEVP